MHDLPMPDDLKPAHPSPPGDELLDQFKEVREVDYKGEHYSVRDNGAVMRHPKPGGRNRAIDNAWTFGKRDDKTGYMLISTHRIHIVVANAFHGVHDSKVYVVDHIDTNRCNNRADNLRWFTRLENALNNPITRKRIEWYCGGDIQKFIDDPSCIRDKVVTPDLSWMKTVTPEEAKNALENLTRWAAKVPSPKIDAVKADLPLDREWMFKPPRPRSSFNKAAWDAQVREAAKMCTAAAQPSPVTMAASPMNARQREWRTPTAFLLCPENPGNNPLLEYFSRLQEGEQFCGNQYGPSTVLEAFLSDDGLAIGVATKAEREDAIKPFAACKITFERGKFVHESIQSCFSSDGALKRATEAAGKTWTGPDSIDDFC